MMAREEQPNELHIVLEDGILEIVMQENGTCAVLQQGAEDCHVTSHDGVVENAVEVVLVGTRCQQMNSLWTASYCSPKENIASFPLLVALRYLAPSVGVPPPYKVDVGTEIQQSPDYTDGTVRLDHLGQDLVDLFVSVLGAGLRGEAIAEPAKRLLVSVKFPLRPEQSCRLFCLAVHCVVG